MFGSEFLFKDAIEYRTVMGLIIGFDDVIKYGFVLGPFLGFSVGIEHIFEYRLLFGLLLVFKYVIEYGPCASEISINTKLNGSLDEISLRWNCIWKA